MLQEAESLNRAVINFSEYSCNNNMTDKAALKFGSEVWVLKKRDEQRLEAAQMKFLTVTGNYKIR